MITLTSFFYGLCVFTTVLYFFGILKRQQLFVKHRIKFNLWHVVFCLTTIPMIMSIIPQIDLSSERVYTLWVVPLAFHISNMADLKEHLIKRK